MEKLKNAKNNAQQITQKLCKAATVPRLSYRSDVLAVTKVTEKRFRLQKYVLRKRKKRVNIRKELQISNITNMILYCTNKYWENVERKEENCISKKSFEIWSTRKRKC
jgi:hypothetical protein